VERRQLKTSARIDLAQWRLGLQAGARLGLPSGLYGPRSGQEQTGGVHARQQARGIFSRAEALIPCLPWLCWIYVFSKRRLQGEGRIRLLPLHLPEPPWATRSWLCDLSFRVGL
jgi:hypothetical protein